MEQAREVSRRDAMKKAVIAGASIGAVWSAPKIQGLSLRPNYAAAASSTGIHQWSRNTGTNASAMANFPEGLVNNPLIGTVTNANFRANRNLATGVGVARIVVIGVGLISKSCDATINSVGGLPVGAEIQLIKNSGSIRRNFSVPGFTGDLPIQATGNFTCQCA